MARKEQCKSPLLHFPLYSVKHKWELLVTVILLNEFNVYGSVHCNNILIYIQQYATLHSLFYLETALHVLGDTSTHHQERKQMYLQHLVFVRPLILPAAIAAGSINGVTNTRCCRYGCMRF